jgi:hypothetical protein
MRKLFSLLAFLLPLSIFAQTTPGITEVTLGGYQFLEHIPQAYKAGQLVNVLIQAPGSGEVGGPIAKDTINGPFASWDGHPGVKDTTVMDPNLVVLAWNPGTSYVANSQVAGVIAAVKSTFNVNKIAVSGLSEGCGDFTNWAYSSYANFSQIAAFFLFSPQPTQAVAYAGPGTQCQWFLKDSAYFYAACATQDPDGFYGPALLEFDSIQAEHPYRTPEFTAMSCSCHSSAAWGQFFSPYWIDPVTGRNIYNQFMYEYPVASVGPPVTPPVTKCPVQRTAIGFTLTYVNGVLTTLVTYSDSTSAPIVVP